MRGQRLGQRQGDVMSQFPAECSPPAQTSLPLWLRVTLGSGGGPGGRRGPQTRHADPGGPATTGSPTSLSLPTPHSHPHSLSHAQAGSDLVPPPYLHAQSTDESDRWKIKIDASEENKSARKSSPKRDVEGKQEEGLPKVPNPRFFKRKGASVRQGPGDGRTHGGPSWAGHPEGESPSCSAQPRRPRRGNSGLGPGLPKSLDAATEAPSSVLRWSPVQVAAPLRLPPGVTARPGAPQRCSARLAPRSPSPERWGWQGRGLRRQWGRGGRDSRASWTDRLARAHPVRGGGRRPPRTRREAETGHPVLDLPVSWLPWEHFVPAKQVTVLLAGGGDSGRERQGRGLLGRHCPAAWAGF